MPRKAVSFKECEDYPAIWQTGKLQAHTRLKAGHRCEMCRQPFHRGTNKAVFARNRLGQPIIGTVHHIDGNKQNCAFSNLVFLCQRCHLKAQPWKVGGKIPDGWRPCEIGWIQKRGLPYVYQLGF